MADVTPIRVVVDGSGDTTGLSEFLSGETLGLVHGGTGATTATGAISSLGLHAVAVSGSYTDLLNKPTTDGITEGTTNLYYTDARVLSYLGTNSYVTQSYVDNAVSNILDGAPGVLDTLNELAAAIGDDANFITTINSSISTVQSNVDALFGSKSTSDLSEGTNLYFTDERVDDRVANLITDGVGITKSYDDVGNLLNIAIDFSEFDSDDIVEGAVNTFLNNKSTDDLSEGSTNLYFTNERVDDRVGSLIVGGTNVTATYSDLNNRLTIDLDSTGGFSLTNNSTSDLQEGSNLYFTNARADARVSAGIASGGVATETYVLSITNPLNAALNAEISATNTDITTLTSSISTETSRATSKENAIQSDLDDEIFDRESAITNLAIGDLFNVDLSTAPTNNQSLIWDNANSKFIAGDSFSQSNFDSSFAAKSTTDLSEGTNLYYTNARVRTEITGASLNMGSNNIITTGKILYGNLYSAVADLPSATTYHGMFAHVHGTGKGYFSHAGGWKTLLDESSSDTSDLSEGTNLYYTNARVDARITNAGAVTQSDIDTAISNLVDSSPATLDTLNELAAALGDDANFSTTITNSIATKLAITDFTSTANTWVGTKSTSDLSEGTNLYYTDVRALAATDGQIVKFANMFAAEGNLPSATTYHGMFAHVHGTGKGYFAHAGSWIKLLDESSSTTTDLTEGTNLYYTDARVDARITNAGIVNNIGDLGDVNLTTPATNGQSLVWDNANSEFIAGDSFSQSDFNTAFTAKSTTDLSEGTNLYYTDARTDARVTAKTVTIISDLDDEIFDRETADADLQTQINALTTYSGFDTDFAAKSTTDLSEGTNLYYTDARVRSHITGTDLDMGSNNITTTGKMLYANMYASEGDLPSATTYHGMFAHVHGTGKGYFAHAGGWKKLLDESSSTTTDITEGTNLYYTDARVQTKLGDVSGNIIPDTDVTYDLGSSTHKFKDLYLSGSTIHLGSIELSDNGGDLEVTPIAGGSTSTFATTTYVTTAIANLVDTAPSTLDTLNELAAALGDDANFASTVTTSLGTKLNLSGGTMTGALDMGSNNVTTTGKVLFANMYAAEANLPSATTYHGMFAHVHATGKGYFAHAGSWIKLLDESSSTTTDITEGTNLYYTDARVRSHITGADLDMGSNDITTTGKMLYANMYAAEANLPSATTYHGMFAHVHGTGKGYFAHAGSWIKLLDESSSTTTNLSEGTNLYYTDARVRSHITGADLDMGSNDITTTGKMLFANMYATTGDLPSATTYHGMFAHVHGTGKGYFAHAGNWVELANNSQIIAQDFSYASLTGAPTIPTSINNLTDVDIYTTAPTNGQTLVWDNANNKFIPGAASGGSYNDAAVDTHLNQSNPTSGYVLSWDGSDYAWVAQSGGGGGAATLQVSDAAPSSPTANDLWLNSTNMKLFVYYADGSSNQWVEVGAGGTISGGGGGSSVSVADTAPTSPSDGDMWFNSTDTKLYIYYNDGSSSQWVQALPSGSGGSSSSSNTWAEKTAAYTVVAGEKLLVDCSSAAVTVTLPASASLGDEIRIIDATGNSSTNNITIARNSHKIQGAASDLTINTNRAAFGLVYYNATQGWLLTEK